MMSINNLRRERMLRVTWVPAGSERHYRDVEQLAQRGQSLPYGYFPYESTYPAWWGRLTNDTALLSGVMATVARSRALPGALILRIEKFGRLLHEPFVEHAEEFCLALRTQSRRTLVIQLALFDEEPHRRLQTQAVLGHWGFSVTPPRSYTRTLRIELSENQQDTLGSFSESARRGIRAFHSAGGHVVRVVEPHMLAWIERLHEETFTRTGGTAPSLALNQAILSIQPSQRAALFAAFAGTEANEEALISFAMVQEHGDYATYEAGGSRKARGNYRNFVCAGGYPIMWECIRWSIHRGCKWFDMGGSLHPMAPQDHALIGIEQFKRRFSKNQIDVGVELSLEPNRSLSRIAATTRTIIRKITAVSNRVR